MNWIWSKEALRRHPAFIITESRRQGGEAGERPSEKQILERAVGELERMGRSLYRLGLTQESIARELAGAVKRSPQSDFHELRRRLAEDYLPVLDSLERLAQTLRTRSDQRGETPVSLKPLAEGAEIVLAKGRTYLEAMGVEPIPALGVEFDPELHQALETRPAPPAMDGKVIEEISRGYRLGTKPIRTSQVVVGRKE